MSSIIQLSDFVGEYELPTSKYMDKQPYLDRYEKEYLIYLLGAELYKLFIADLDANGEPQTPIYQNIYNPFEEDDHHCVRYSEGMKLAIVQVVYFYLVRDLPVNKTNTGVMFNDNETAKGPYYNGFNIVEAYNQGIKNLREIQWYICENMTDYPDFNGQRLDFNAGL
jgi:hypothetical protein